MTEQEAYLELKSMGLDKLDLVPFTEVKLICQGKRCNCSTTVRDYGIHPEYYHKRMKWHNVSNMFFACAKHWKLYRRLIKNYPNNIVQEKIFDFSKNVIRN